MAKNGNSIDPAELVEALEVATREVAAIDAQLEGLKGTQAELLKKAHGLAVTAPVPMDLVPTQPEDLTIGGLSSWCETITAAVDQYEDELVSLWFASNRPKDGAEELKSARAVLVDEAEALGKVLVMMGVIDEAPTFGKAPSSKGTRAPVTHGAQFYVILEGKARKNMAPSQNSLSSVAYYYSADLLKEEARTSTETLKAAISKAGVTPGATAWSATLPGGVVGMDVIDAE